MSRAEIEHQLAFAERQHENWRLRVVQHQLRAQLAMAKQDFAEAEKQLGIARKWLHHLDDCNEAIDMSRRALNPGVDDPPVALRSDGQ